MVRERARKWSENLSTKPCLELHKTRCLLPQDPNSLGVRSCGTQGKGFCGQTASFANAVLNISFMSNSGRYELPQKESDVTEFMATGRNEGSV